MEENKVTCSVDSVIFSLIDGDLNILMIKRDREPFKDCYVLPGGLVLPNDASIDDSVKRVLFSKTGVKVNYMEQLQTYGDVMRDERSMTISVAYMALVNDTKVSLDKEGVFAPTWLKVSSLPSVKLGFDHAKIIGDGLSRLRNKVNYSSLPVHLMEDKFTLPDLQKVYEGILGVRLDKSSFRKKMMETGVVSEVEGEYVRQGAHRPSQLYSIKRSDGEVKNFDKNIRKFGQK